MKKGPFGKFAVDVDNGFEPYYVVDRDKKKKVAELKRLLKDADELYLATDEDREGEAIAWHLLEALKPQVPVKRMVFHEITREAIQRAVTDTRELDTALVDAQETRRILDRLYGYEVSPVLWRKVRQGLSAGRVQSVATRMVVERERERMAFVRPPPTGTSRATSRPSAGERSTLHRAARRRRRRPRRHRPRLRRRPAQLKRQGRRPPRRGARDPDRRRPACRSSRRSRHRRPGEALHAPPVGAVHDLDPPAGGVAQAAAVARKNAMRVAQRLYENGYITYMRTDSSTLSDARDRRPRAARRATCTAPSTCPDEPAPLREARSRTRRRPTRPSARPATVPHARPRSPASCAARSSRSTS